MFMRLIPKEHQPLAIKDFRPISVSVRLCMKLAKVLSEIEGFFA